MKMRSFVKAPATAIDCFKNGSKDLNVGILSSAKFSKIKYDYIHYNSLLDSLL
jgi:hypothetical protein